MCCSHKSSKCEVAFLSVTVFLSGSN
uniref:Uncharacterized protein n=1 Tax=Rhizophora mucronata TaxID=61149 RepID=A0A2P2PBT0_RHIMU